MTDKTDDKKIMEYLKNISGKHTREIDDFDSALLYELFEGTTGTPREKYDKLCDRLVLVASRLEKQYLTENNGSDRPDILSKIEGFLKDSKLSEVSPNIEDYAQREGRVISILSNDKKLKCSCTYEIFNKTVDRITEEQYFQLMTIAELKESSIPWHKNDWVEELNPEDDTAI